MSEDSLVMLVDPDTYKHRKVAIEEELSRMAEDRGWPAACFDWLAPRTHDMQKCYTLVMAPTKGALWGAIQRVA